MLYNVVKVATLMLVIFIFGCGGGGGGSEESTSTDGKSDITLDNIAYAALGTRLSYYLPTISSRIVTAVNLLGTSDSTRVACRTIDHNSSTSYITISSNKSGEYLAKGDQINIDFNQCIISDLLDAYTLDGSIDVTLESVSFDSEGKLSHLSAIARSSSLYVYLESEYGIIPEWINYDVALELNQTGSYRYQLKSKSESGISIGGYLNLTNAESIFEYDLLSSEYSMDLNGQYNYSLGQDLNYELSTESPFTGKLGHEPKAGTLVLSGERSNKISYTTQSNAEIEVSINYENDQQAELYLHYSEVWGGNGSLWPIGRYDFLDRNGSYKSHVLSSQIKIYGDEVEVAAPYSVDTINDFNSYLVLYDNVELNPKIELFTTSYFPEDMEFYLEGEYIGNRVNLNHSIDGNKVVLMAVQDLEPNTTYFLKVKDLSLIKDLVKIKTIDDSISPNKLFSIGEDRFITNEEWFEIYASYSDGHTPRYISWTVNSNATILNNWPEYDLFRVQHQGNPGDIITIGAKAEFGTIPEQLDKINVQVSDSSIDKSYLEFSFPNDEDYLDRALFIGDVLYSSDRYGDSAHVSLTVRRFEHNFVTIDFYTGLYIDESTIEFGGALVEYLNEGIGTKAFSDSCKIEKVILKEHEVERKDHELMTVAVDLELICSSGEIVRAKLRKNSSIL
ncbi:hypothetical protein [Vibrio sp. SCSIO 43136]|uniref:hypothetical protein n=1 Tax=Vibrio sp. SCSIO 43136 TaxID=2819101 RepID=UPI0020763679|nr:hypothetical protein [Vibrio sp. SCSIO 43136]USD64441.1 hypothetical protein J4N39_10030 [Vibrio sp. SCSIO 43136]